MSVESDQESIEATAAGVDARLAAFCSPSAREVFHPIVYQPQIWTTDPYDVETIHAEAREVFSRLLRRAAGPRPPEFGKILMLHGEAGSGKTHLLRAFRGLTHADGIGYFGYLQMTTEFTNYGRYLLSKLIDSLDQPYFPPHVEKSGLMRLSTWVFEAVPGLTDAERMEVTEGEITSLAARANELADRALSDPRLADCDLDLIRVLIYLQRGDPRIKAKALKWLRCDDLSAYDRAALDLVPRTQEEHPLRMVAELGRLMAVTQGAPLVLCVDQLEDMFQTDIAAEKFRRVIDTLVSLVDLIPTVVVVLACLEDYYQGNKQYLTAAKLDRLEHDPLPVRLNSLRTFAEIEAMVTRRLEALFEPSGIAIDPSNPTSPFPEALLRRLENLGTRKVLEFCQEQHQQCVAAGRWVDPRLGVEATPAAAAASVKTAEDSGAVMDLEPIWNDFRASFPGVVPEEEAGLAELIAWGAEQCGVELPTGYRFATRVDGRVIHTHAQWPRSAGEAFLVAICDRSAPGGGLANQVTDAERRASGMPIVLVRSTAFPNPRAAVSRQIGALIAKGGRTVVVENADFLALLALRAFQKKRGEEQGYTIWQRSTRPISQLAAMRKILALEKLPPPAAGDSSGRSSTPALPAAVIPAAPVLPPQPSPAKTETDRLELGDGRGLAGAPVHMIAKELKQHMAFLGGSGSGKTTAAMSLIEQLLLHGVPALLVDRKGDLCRYADPEAWLVKTGDARAAERQQLRDRIDVAVYTPGSTEGRPLSIPLVPEDLGSAPTTEREQVAAQTSASISSMMGYKGRGSDSMLQAILTKAIEVLASISDRPITIEALHALVADQDQALLNAVGGYEPKQYKKLADDLLTLRLQHKALISADADRLDVDALLGRGPHGVPGKTRLSIISTQFLGSAGAIDFWMAQFFLALDRWRGKTPSDYLQAVILLDEADQYLPAVRQPATKPPLESLLRRARSAGLGIMLATQSPGDFDYRCKENIRAWLVGRVKEQTALNKLKPLFAEARIDAAAKLPGQSTGEFYLLREREVVSLKAHRSLIETRQLPEQRILELARASLHHANGP